MWPSIEYFVLWALLPSISHCIPQIDFPTGAHSKSSSPFEGLRECPQGSDQLLNDCIKLVLEDTRQFAASGIPQVGVEPHDPWHLKDEFIIPIADSVQYKWKNIVLRGLSNYTIGEMVVNTKRKTISMRYIYPFLRITADYVRGGHLLWLPLTGAGKVQLDIINYHHNGTLFLEVVEQAGGGEPVLQVKCAVLEGAVEEIHSYVPNLANSGFWGEFMDYFLNDNAKWIYEEFVWPNVKPQMEHLFVKDWNDTLATVFPSTYFINN